MILASLGLIAAPAVVLPAHAAKKDKRPNVIFIMSDDHTTQAIGAYGSRLAGLNPTPTIDRLAKEGVLFENAFVTNAISTPSRACIMTGQYSQTNGALDLSHHLAPENQYLAQEMSKLGYQTAMIGKWHLKDRPEAFDYYRVFYGQGSYFDPVLVARDDKEVHNIMSHGRKQKLVGKLYKGHSSDIVTDITLDWLKNKRDKKKPFFLCHHFKAPHDMFENNPKYDGYLENTYIPEPASLWDNKNNGSIATKGWRNSLENIIGSSVGRRCGYRNMGDDLGIDRELGDKEFKAAAYQKYLKRYLRCVKGVDDNVKRLFDYLEKEGLMDNTIIMYTGDQGFMLGEHDYIDKRWMYEESMHMPFLVRYPKKIKQGIKTDAIINNVDYAPTIISLAGGEVPEYMQGDDFSEILYTGKEPADWKKATYYRYWMHMYHHNNPGHFGIRTKKYKLIFFYGKHYDPNVRAGLLANMTTPAGWEFYDLEKDPHEMNNCYKDKKYKAVIADLKKQLKQMRIDLNETDAKYPHIQKVIDKYWNK